MINVLEYKGTRWFKCDLHLHTTASACFQDRAVTAEQWVTRAIAQGLNCVAVTDHNTGTSIDEIKAAALSTELVVFPGVEITCDTSKIHLLILFDTSKSSADIRDFLVRADIKADDFGKQDAYTSKSVFDIVELATTDGALVIPAHVDEYNGLGSISVGNLKKLYSEGIVTAVQVVHKEFLDTGLQTTGNAALKAKLNDYYNNPNPAIDDSTVKEWHAPVKYALESDLAILTFSDNPHAEKNSKHGLDGIGKRYTWIKMDATPSLEGLRQAFLVHEHRVKNDFLATSTPYKVPDLWIQSLVINNTSLTDTGVPLQVDFSPQLTTLIGGRGSGKSSILRFIRGILNRIDDLQDLPEILNDHHEFYRKEAGRPKKGVLLEGSIVELNVIRNGILHKLIATDITDSTKQKLSIQRYDQKTTTWNEINDEGYIDFFSFEHYSQKQIYEIAQEPNALRERIDRAIEGLEKIKSDREHTRSLFLEKSAGLRTADQRLSGRGKIETRIKDLDESLKKLQESGISDLLKAKEKFAEEEQTIGLISKLIDEKQSLLSEATKSLDFDVLPIMSNFDAKHLDELDKSIKTVVDGFADQKKKLEEAKEQIEQIKTTFLSSLENSAWKKDYNKNAEDFESKKQELSLQGIDDIENFEKLTNEKSELEKELENLKLQESTRNSESDERSKLQLEYLNLSKAITQKRREFLTSVLQDDKVKINIKPFRNQADFEAKLRKIIQRDDRFQQDIDSLAKLCFEGNVEQKIVEVREVFTKIKKGEDVSDRVTGHFVNLINSLNEAQIDELELFLPEDEIEVQYRTSTTGAFKSLSTASAGQKTTAILTFLLSYGNLPLILDQPEDDLDNRLVYDLIVDRLKQAKEHRQLIVVTHNANVPVNGDAEYIVSMDSDSKNLKILHTGTVEQQTIKKEICDVMEGGEFAFKMRARRYNRK